ncbi:DNA-binding transcriptional regulator Nlp [compost metagenome]
MNQKELGHEDWSRGRILEAVRERGMSMRKLSEESGRKPATLYNALRTDEYVLGEQIIAEFLGVDPSEIWPSRYRRREEIKARQDEALGRVEAIKVALRA